MASSTTSISGGVRATLKNTLERERGGERKRERERRVREVSILYMVGQSRAWPLTRESICFVQYMSAPVASVSVN